MGRQLVFYLDNCVFSELLKPENASLRSLFSRFPHRLAFSDVHISEMVGNQDSYSELLNHLNAVFVRNPGQNDGKYHPIASFDSAAPEERFSDYRDFSSIYDAFEAMLSPLQYFMGGQREANIDNIVSGTEEKIVNSLTETGIFESEPLRTETTDALAAASDSLRSIYAADSFQRIERQFNAARHGDPMRNMNPIERVNHVVAMLDEQEKRHF